MLVIPPDLSSSDFHLALRTTDLNNDPPLINQIIAGSGKPRPIARYVNAADIADPPAPAWYLPAANDLYIHVDRAGITAVPEIEWYRIYGTTDANMARIVGLFCHEAGHAAISDDMTPVQMDKANRRHWDLLSLLEELRVENYALRKTATARRFLRASFAIVLGNMPDEFTNKAHVVRAWAMCRGRTLAGVAAADETDAVDLAARTLLGDDVVDGLTDLLQEALTLRLNRDEARERIVDICDEWVELVGESAEATGCTHCAREAKPGEETTAEMTEAKASGKPDEGEPEEQEGSASSGVGDGDDGDELGEADKGHGEEDGEEDGDFVSGWGDPGFEGESDRGAIDELSDEDAELMSMLARDLTELMQEEWTREADSVVVANAAEWATKVFGNRRQSPRLTRTAPTTAMRQHVVTVAQALSTLSLPTITKSVKMTEVPPGRLRSREALRASAERAQGKMVTARPWKGTVRRHAVARPLVVGIATDTSGSMRWAESGVAEFAYVYTNAGHRIGARTAAVTFGDSVHRICRPGEVMTHVQRKTASDGTESFDHAMAALDGVLHLTSPAYAARILMVISDGALVKGGESERAAEWLKRMTKAGTHVLWIGDRDKNSYMNWLSKLGRKLDRLTLIDVETRYQAGGKRRVYDILSDAALDAIRANVL
jgi:hypothetical protein